jgi:hypothetical protein
MIIDETKIRVLADLDYKYGEVINREVRNQFDLALENGDITAYIDSNIIETSAITFKKLFSDTKYYDLMAERNFWGAVAEISNGKKISLAFESHLELYYSSLQYFIEEYFPKVPRCVIVWAMLDLEKASKYFTKQSIKVLNLRIGRKQYYLDNDLEKNIENYIEDKANMPVGFHNWVAKTTPVSLGLNMPENKMAMMVWQRKIGEIKITQKVFNKVIETLSKDTTINNQQWDIILEKVGTPKWLSDWHYKSYKPTEKYGANAIYDLILKGTFERDSKMV